MTKWFEDLFNKGFNGQDIPGLLLDQLSSRGLTPAEIARGFVIFEFYSKYPKRELGEKLEVFAPKDRDQIFQYWLEDCLINADGEVVLSDRYPGDLFLGTEFEFFLELVSSCPKEAERHESIYLDNITVLDIQSNSNELRYIPGLSGMTKLEELYCGDNRIEELDFSKNHNLKIIGCSNNPLSDETIQRIKAQFPDAEC